jgi:CRISPR-associated protein Cmr1
MQRLTFTVRFTTPAFLGNAEQNGQWRTPPFKALLRQWWRVAYAADHGFAVDVAAMRREEGLLFGNAWLENQFCKSLVRIRLDKWDEGSENKTMWGQQELQPNSRVAHPEVGQIGPMLYLGYGPLVVEEVRTQGQRKFATVLKKNAAIQEGETAMLSLAVPDEHAPRIERALWLMDRYGTLGGRSRNGWGSFSLLPLPLGEGWGEGKKPPTRSWRDCLGLDWPHAIGHNDRGPLIWQTAPCNEWKALMRELAIIKIGLRTQFRFPDARPPHDNPLDRHWLSYPITKHSIRAWGNKRLPNSLRFKVRLIPNDAKQVVGVIVHVPCLPPPEFRPDSRAIVNVWQRVHAFLDAPAQRLTRILE